MATIYWQNHSTLKLNFSIIQLFNLNFIQWWWRWWKSYQLSMSFHHIITLVILLKMTFVTQFFAFEESFNFKKCMQTQVDLSKCTVLLTLMRWIMKYHKPWECCISVQIQSTMPSLNNHQFFCKGNISCLSHAAAIRFLTSIKQYHCPGSWLR